MRAERDATGERQVEMYLKVRAVDVVRVPPERFGEDIVSTVKELLEEKLEGRLDKKVGMFIAILDVISIGEGRILIGDAGIYYETVFDTLVYRPKLQEITEGEVVEVVEFGAFIEIGPLDGLLHISQITDEYISYDEKGGRLVGKESGKSLTAGERVRARIVAISLNEKEPSDSKIGLTMRQPGLGTYKWLEEERAKKQQEELK
ncbi:MAG: DNA-directed RNA polymerase [Canidatus Methanoxibalbensis ujae]|nr:DNA-directed RNA polymerase [Candidatus Methanoxibalbensis ujae]MCW7077935.1 DNA-directed RNA polymerase [Candidatus Methanoxibalbensis ujae]